MTIVLLQTSSKTTKLNRLVEISLMIKNKEKFVFFRFTLTFIICDVFYSISSNFLDFLNDTIHSNLEKNSTVYMKIKSNCKFIISCVIFIFVKQVKSNEKIFVQKHFSQIFDLLKKDKSFTMIF